MKITERQLRRIIREERHRLLNEQWRGADKVGPGGLEMLEDWGGMSGHGGIVKALYKGDDPQTAEDWIIVTDDGGYYKVGGEYMVWTWDWNQVAWSYEHMEKMVSAAKAGQDPPRDPGYQT